ncbi:MAG: GNAT family N-acetyltransferase, partial [Chitinophagales bacterium]
HGENYIQSNFNYDKLSDEISNPNSIFFLIQLRDKPVGLVKLNIDSGTYGYPADIALELERIYFIKEASGQGLGKTTIDFIINFARQKSKKLIWLKAMDSSGAVEFYKKQGFEINDETCLDYPEIKDEYKKMFVMCKEL